MAKKFVGNIVSVSGGNKKQRTDVFAMKTEKHETGN